MKNLKLTLILVLVTFISFQSCNKENLIEEQNEAALFQTEKSEKAISGLAENAIQSGKTFICNGKAVDPRSINWDKDGVNIFYGFDETKNVYVFNSDEEMVEWLKNTKSKRTEEILTVLKNIEKARSYAEKIGEFEKKETSEEFDKFMETNFSTHTKGLGIFYHDKFFYGRPFPISAFPKGRLKRRNDNEASSLKYLGNTMRMSSKKYWRGTHKWVFAVAYEEIGDLGYFDNKLSSYWNW